MNIAEETIPNDLLDNIRGCANEALKAFGDVIVCFDPASIVDAIDNFVFQWQRGNRPSTDFVEEEEHAKLIIASLWGEQLVKQFQWQWAKMTFCDGNGTIGVFSLGRSLAIYPFDYVGTCLLHPEVDVTVMLAFNMLVSDAIPKFPENSYTNVMEGVQRIVPR